MDRNSQDAALQTLIEAAYRQTLAGFEREVNAGQRKPAEELDGYRRRRRNYGSCLRMDHAPEEARELASRLLQTHGIHLEPHQLARFERDVTKLLIRLYDAFIAAATPDQGKR